MGCLYRACEPRGRQGSQCGRCWAGLERAHPSDFRRQPGRERHRETGYSVLTKRGQTEMHCPVASSQPWHLSPSLLGRSASGCCSVVLSWRPKPSRGRRTHQGPLCLSSHQGHGENHLDNLRPPQPFPQQPLSEGHWSHTTHRGCLPVPLGIPPVPSTLWGREEGLDQGGEVPSPWVWSHCVFQSALGREARGVAQAWPGELSLLWAPHHVPWPVAGSHLPPHVALNPCRVPSCTSL